MLLRNRKGLYYFYNFQWSEQSKPTSVTSPTWPRTTKSQGVGSSREKIWVLVSLCRVWCAQGVLQEQAEAMVGPADRGEASASIAIATRGGDVCAADPWAQSDARDAWGQLPADQIEHPLEYNAVQPAAGPVAKAEGVSGEAAAIAVPEGGGGLSEATGSQAGVL